MGKRSGFQRRPQDRYQTIDPRAVKRLVPFLNPEDVRTFGEPCAGAGELIRQLESYGYVCVLRGDLDSGSDALKLTRRDVSRCDVLVTNPPWTRALLHGLLAHFIKLKVPTWLLFDSDWAYNLHARPYLPHCQRIVAVGRLLWMPGTTMSGKDNCSWYLFQGDHLGGPHFHGRQ